MKNIILVKSSKIEVGIKDQESLNCDFCHLNCFDIERSVPNHGHQILKDSMAHKPDDLLVELLAIQEI